MQREWDERDRRDRYGSRPDDHRARGSGHGRDWSDRAGDEVRSWMGDDDAEHRRRMDEDRDSGWRGGDRGYRSGERDDSGGYGNPSQRSGYRGSSDGWPSRGDARTAGVYRSSGYDRGESQGRGSYDSRRPSGYGYDTSYGEDRYRSGSSGNSQDRGFLERAGDEVASWFGDEEAERRRRMDDRHRGRGPKNYARSDDRIREDVNDRLSDDPHIDASDIEVAVKDGEVTLSGTVSERFAKRHAEDIAERVSGVKHVQNNVRVSDPRNAGSNGAGATGTATSGTTSLSAGGNTAGSAAPLTSGNR